MQKLTRAEEQLMQVIWELENAFLKEIMAAIPTPKPSQSTVSTVLRILKEKGFVDYRVIGKIHQYFPLVAKEVYAKAFFQQFLGKYFEGSFQKLLSFFHQEGEINLQELDDVLRQLEDHDTADPTP